MTREELADRVAALINAQGDYVAKAWRGGDRVRVYLKEDRGRKGMRELGFAEVELGGSLRLNEVEFKLRYHRELLAAILALPAAQAEEAIPRTPRTPEASKDEDIRQFEASERCLDAAECSRELG